MLRHRYLPALAMGLVCLVIPAATASLGMASAQGASDDPFGDIDLESLKKYPEKVPGGGSPAETEVAPPPQESPPVPEEQVHKESVRKEIVEIEKGSRERKAILDVVRASVERRLGIKVIFVVERLAVYGDWAYANLHPRTEAGKRIDYRRTHYAKDYIPDLDSDAVDVLLRRGGTSWSIVQEAFLPTDVVWEEWVKTYNVPRELFLPED
ncbi:MAG: hypothetical protein K8F92_15560 [Hyphomicrobium sp.]|uniref:hypothetical protein n=1 Tax=Hyphomicrobium sp. TaxID=82 RepID=UPI001320A5F0|nr:hypothetical protein [Hyphomicrobium sp.]KAB2938000.1 MAG: hypothetical protein F9K20_19295 [Hyphomicrobium sp.]MBZ0211047.1 hypothetical protein [Hyphomicrobium sp.]